MTVGRLIKAGLTGVTVFLWILMAGLLTGCGSRSGEIAEETVKDENIETEADIFLPETAAPFPTVPPDALVRTDGIDGSFGIGSASVLRGKNILVSLFLTYRRRERNLFTETEGSCYIYRRNCFRLRRGNPVYSGLE